MENHIKWGLFWFIALSTVGFMFVHGPKPSTEAKNHRDNQLEDRKFFQEEKKSALVRLRSCYDDAEKNYTDYWTRACKTVNTYEIEDCMNKSVPEAVCRAKFTFSPNCELPSHRATAASSFREERKRECNMMFKLEVSPVGDASETK